MSDELKKLKQDYRAIKAPPYLSTRIRAAVADDRKSSHAWMPVMATALAVVAIAWVLPLMMQQQTAVTPRPTKPSLTALASLMPKKPTVTTTSLSQLRTVKVPKLPAKPKTVKPQANYQIDDELLKENDHALI